MRTRVRPAGYRPAVHPRKLLARIRRGSLANVRFEDMRRLVEAFGFRLERVHGSHHRLVGRYALILEDES